MTRTPAPALVLTIAALAAFGCGGPPREATEAAPGQSTAPATSSPAPAVADVPVYPGAEQIDAGESARGEHRTDRTGDDAGSVIAFYEAEMPALGWTKASTIPLDSTVTTVWTKSGGESVSVSIAPRQGGADVVVMRGRGGS